MTQPDVQNERLFSFASRYCYNDILAIFRKHVPSKSFVEDIEEVLDNGAVDNARSVEMLKRLGKENGFTTLEDAICKWIPWILKAESEGWADNQNAPETGADKVMKDFA